MSIASLSLGMSGIGMNVVQLAAQAAVDEWAFAISIDCTLMPGRQQTTRPPVVSSRTFLTVINQYQQGVTMTLGRVTAVKDPVCASHYHPSNSD